jgi:hypothetical protein
MCFSEEVSWLTFGVGMAGSLVLGATRPALGLFFANVALMQMYEALLWRERGRCTPTNGTVSRVAAVTNHLQPVLLLVACRALMKPMHDDTFAWLALGAYLVVAIGATRRFVASGAEACTELTEHGLEWKWNQAGAPLYALYLLSVWATLHAYFGHCSRVLWSTMLSFVASYLIYSDAKMVGSMWCFFGAWLPWFLR